MPKGVYPRTEYHKNIHRKRQKLFWQNTEYRNHMSEAHKEQHSSPETEFKKGEMSGKNNPNWQGGKYIGTHGYIHIYKPEHPFCDCRGTVRQSHLAMEKKIGRYLIPPEIVHHKGINYPLNSIKNKQDDSPENLQLFANNSEHMKFHHPKGSCF